MGGEVQEPGDYSQKGTPKRTKGSRGLRASLQTVPDARTQDPRNGS